MSVRMVANYPVANTEKYLSSLQLDKQLHANEDENDYRNITYITYEFHSGNRQYPTEYWYNEWTTATDFLRIIRN
jgi:hypothetical protein